MTRKASHTRFAIVETTVTMRVENSTLQVAIYNVSVAESAPQADTGICVRYLYSISSSTDRERRAGLSAIAAEPLVKLPIAYSPRTSQRGNNSSIVRDLRAICTWSFYITTSLEGCCICTYCFAYSCVRC